MAYSDRINDAAIKKYRAYSRMVRIILFVLLSGAVGIAAFISKKVGATTAAAITVAAIVVFGFLTKPWLAFEKDWEGEVVSKEKEYTYSKSFKMMLDPQRKPAVDKQGNVIPYVKSILKIKKDDGSEYVYSGVDDDELPEVCYYRIGDRVHHYAGLKLFEKEDKSKDRSVLLCLRCLTLTPKSADKCQKCGLTLLK